MVVDQQKAQARLSWVGSGEASTDNLWFEAVEKHGPTEFLGYQLEAAEGNILDLVKGGGKGNRALQK